MKIVKAILLIIVSLVAIILIAGLLVEKDYSVERSITINKPKAAVFDYIKQLKNQNNYSKWALMDPAMKKTYTGTDATVGFITAWDGNSDVGKGEQEIKKIVEGERLETEIRFQKPMRSVAPSFMTTETTGDNQTKVTWGFNGHMPYPFNVARLFMNVEEMIGKDLATGLENLKRIMEK